MSRSISIVLFAALVGPAPALVAQETQGAAPVSPLLGAWEMTMETPRGTMTQRFVFSLEEDQVKGVVHTRRGTVELQNLTFTDGELTFDLGRRFGDRVFTQRVTATVDGDTMTGTMSGARGGERSFTATRQAT